MRLKTGNTLCWIIRTSDRGRRWRGRGRGHPSFQPMGSGPSLSTMRQLAIKGLTNWPNGRICRRSEKTEKKHKHWRYLPKILLGRQVGLDYPYLQQDAPQPSNATKMNTSFDRFFGSNAHWNNSIENTIISSWSLITRRRQIEKLTIYMKFLPASEYVNGHCTAGLLPKKKLKPRNISGSRSNHNFVWPSWTVWPQTILFCGWLWQ